MKNFTKVQWLSSTAVAWLLAFNSCIAAPATKAEAEPTINGSIQLADSNGVGQCEVPIPEIEKTYILENETGCKGIGVKSFQLTNVPSATDVRFYSARSCNLGGGEEQFFVHFKTVKDNLSWDKPMDIDTLVKQGQGLVPGGWYIRIADSWTSVEGSAVDMLNCIVINRSQPVQ